MADVQVTPDNAGLDQPSLIELNNNLDSLWVQYLSSLDQYQKSQEELQRYMSSGFFSLTQANFKSPNRRRYGQDYYDDRMKASKSCKLASNGASKSTSVTLELVESTAMHSETQGGPDMEQSEKEEPTQQPSPPATPAPEDHSPPSAATEKDSEASAASSTSACDPLKWFGILIPKDLRSAQASFVVAVQHHAISASNAARGMRELEAEIRRVRKLVRKAEKAGT